MSGIRGETTGAIGLILRMGVGMAFFVFGGYALDRVFDTSPWLLVAGTVLGAALALGDLARRAHSAGGEEMRWRKR